jgi:hypothetical protein
MRWCGIIGLVLGIAFLLVTSKIFTSLRNGLEPSLITKYSIFRQAFGKNFEFSERQKCSSSDKLFGLITYKLIRKHIHSDTLKIA